MLKYGLLLIFSCFFLKGYAQKWHFGPDLGGNLVAVEQDSFGKDFKPLFHVGGFVSYQFNGFFSLKSGVYFSQKTHTIHQNDTSKLNLFGFEDQIPAGANADLNIYTAIKSRTTQYYVEMPLLATYSYKQFSAFLGPYVGYMVFARSKTETVTNVPLLQAVDVSSLDPTGTIATFLPDPYEFKESTSKKGLNGIDLGLRGGVGMDFQHVGVALSYNYGLLPFRSKVQSGDVQFYNYFQTTINYKFSCKKKNRLN